MIDTYHPLALGVRYVLLQRGRAYPQNKGRMLVQVFHKEQSVVEMLATQIGGNFYSHRGRGFLWTTAKRPVLMRLAQGLYTEGCWWEANAHLLPLKVWYDTICAANQGDVRDQEQPADNALCGEQAGS